MNIKKMSDCINHFIETNIGLELGEDIQNQWASICQSDQTQVQEIYDQIDFFF